MKKHVCLSIIVLTALQLSPSWGQKTITTFAGTGELYASDPQATNAEIGRVRAVAFDSNGNYYLTSTSTQKVYKVDGSGIITTVAGTGTVGSSGDGGPAISAQLYNPSSVDADGSGNLFIADESNRIRRVDASSGVITTVAGTGTGGYSGDGGPATSAQLSSPSGVVADDFGNLYIAERIGHRVRKVDASTGVITTIAGTGTAGYSGDGGPATSAQINNISGIALDDSGNLFIADAHNDRVRRVDASTGVITTVAGTGNGGYSGDGNQATSAQLNYPSGVVVDGSGDLYIAEYFNRRVRKVDASTGVITTVAGTGDAGYSGDGGPATSAQLRDPVGVAIDGSGNLYIADQSDERVRKVNASTGVITTVAGTGSYGYSGDGGPATSAQLNFPSGVAKDASGNLYIADNSNNLIRKVDASTGIITTVAGNRINGYNGDGGPATSAQLNFPFDIAFDGSGNLYIADRENHRIRKVDASTGVITTVAGTGINGYNGDGFMATSAQLNYPSGVAVDGSGNLYIADVRNHRIRRINASTGVITTVAGTGTNGYSGDGGTATLAQLYGPFGVTFDELENLYIADRVNQRIRKVDVSTGVITTVAGTGAAGFDGDGGPATSAQLWEPYDVTVDGLGNLYISDESDRIRKVDASTGMIMTVAGTGTSGYSGDGGPATSAQLNSPRGILVDGSGNLYIADQRNHRIRRVTDTPPSLTISSPEGDPANVSPIQIIFEFDKNVSGFTASDITVTNGSISNFAGSGKYYTADLSASADGIVTVDVNSNVATDAAGNGNKSARQFSITIDAFVATVSSLTVPANHTYIKEENLDFTVNFSEHVTVNTNGGTPHLSLDIGGSTRLAEYTSGSGTTALLFRYTVQFGDVDKDGISINSLAANGGTIEDNANKQANLALNAVESTTSVLVDADAGNPVIYSGFTPDADGINDAWEIDNASANPNMTVSIYNSNGQELFKSAEGYPKPWDGTYNGRQLPFGTYYYVIRLNDNTGRTFKGTVMILK